MEFISAKTIVTKINWNNWFGTDYNMNIYKGCNHGCIYCDSRSDCYGVDDFDTVRGKKNALEIIEKELKNKRKTGVIATGSMSDPYNFFEREHKLSRGALSLIDKYGFGISIATKSDLITRDIDILKRISKHSPIIIKLTITAVDDTLCKKIEQNVVPSSKRFKTIKKLSDNDIYTGVLMAPILPFIEDNEENIKSIVDFASQSGAKFIYPNFGVTLRGNQRDWYYKKLDENFPTVKGKYVKKFGDSYQCDSEKVKQLRRIFMNECERHDILYRMQDIINGYKSKYSIEQVSLFDFKEK